MLHDVVISAGIYSLFGFEVTPPTVIAFLTILGYSLYDTIVVFDRVRENERRVAVGRTLGRRPRQRVDQPGADALAEHVDLGDPAGDRRCWSSAPESSARSRCRSSPSPCSSACSPAPTRRSSSPRRCSACSSGDARPRPWPPARSITWPGEDLRTVVVRGVGVLAPRAERRRAARAARAVATPSSGATRRRAPATPSSRRHDARRRAAAVVAAAGRRHDRAAARPPRPAAQEEAPLTPRRRARR